MLRFTSGSPRWAQRKSPTAGATRQSSSNSDRLSTVRSLRSGSKVSVERQEVFLGHANNKLKKLFRKTIDSIIKRNLSEELHRGFFRSGSMKVQTSDLNASLGLANSSIRRKKMGNLDSKPQSQYSRKVSFKDGEEDDNYRSSNVKSREGSESLSPQQSKSKTSKEASNKQLENSSPDGDGSGLGTSHISGGRRRINSSFTGSSQVRFRNIGLIQVQQGSQSLIADRSEDEEGAGSVDNFRGGKAVSKTKLSISTNQGRLDQSQELEEVRISPINTKQMSPDTKPTLLAKSRNKMVYLERCIMKVINRKTRKVFSMLDPRAPGQSAGLSDVRENSDSQLDSGSDQRRNSPNDPASNERLKRHAKKLSSRLEAGNKSADNLNDPSNDLNNLILFDSSRPGPQYDERNMHSSRYQYADRPFLNSSDRIVFSLSEQNPEDALQRQSEVQNHPMIKEMIDKEVKSRLKQILSELPEDLRRQSTIEGQLTSPVLKESHVIDFSEKLSDTNKSQIGSNQNMLYSSLNFSRINPSTFINLSRLIYISATIVDKQQFKQTLSGFDSIRSAEGPSVPLTQPTSVFRYSKLLDSLTQSFARSRTATLQGAVDMIEYESIQREMRSLKQQKQSACIKHGLQRLAALSTAKSTHNESIAFFRIHSHRINDAQSTSAKSALIRLLVRNSACKQQQALYYCRQYSTLCGVMLIDQMYRSCARRRGVSILKYRFENRVRFCLQKMMANSRRKHSYLHASTAFCRSMNMLISKQLIFGMNRIAAKLSSSIAAKQLVTYVLSRMEHASCHNALEQLRSFTRRRHP